MIDNNMEFIDIFEEKLAQFTGAKYAVATDCCTNALLISLYLKRSLSKISNNILFTSRTYMSVPMTLKLFGFNVSLMNCEWSGWYPIFDSDTGKPTGVVDAAVFFKLDMWREIPIEDKLVCLSFQQKKRLNLGRGGAILTDNEEYYRMLKRLVHDGRNSKIYHGDEIENRAEDIIVGFHSYLEPEKAAKGIQMLNQSHYLPPFKNHGWRDYPDLLKLNILKHE